MTVRRSIRPNSMILLGATVSVVIIGLGMAPPAEDPASQPEEIRKLLEEQKAVLQEAVRLAGQEYRTGRTGFDSLFELQRDLLKVELQTAANREERIKLHEEFVELANGFETIATELYRTGQVTQVDVLKAKVALLQSKIDLERAKSMKD